MRSRHLWLEVPGLLLRTKDSRVGRPWLLVGTETLRPDIRCPTPFRSWCPVSQTLPPSTDENETKSFPVRTGVVQRRNTFVSGYSPEPSHKSFVSLRHRKHGCPRKSLRRRTLPRIGQGRKFIKCRVRQIRVRSRANGSLETWLLSNSTESFWPRTRTI